MAIDGLHLLSIQDAERSKLPQRLLCKPREATCDLHEEGHGSWHKNVLCGASQDKFTEPGQVVIA